MRSVSPLAALLIVIAIPADAAEPTQKSSPVLDQLRSCRSIADPSGRLTCFDSQVKLLEEAVSDGQVVLLSSKEVRATKRSLFGFSLPKLPYFNDDREKEQEISGTITRVRHLGYGKWRIHLEDGAVWETVEAAPANVLIDTGSTVQIRKAALGSYLMKIGGQRAVRARRIS